MNTEEQARERLAQQRQHDEHLKQSMLHRAEAEVNHPTADNWTQEQARELTVKERQHDEHLKESMLERAKSETGRE